MNKIRTSESGHVMEMEFVRITPEDAQFMLDRYEYDGQRNVRPSNETFLVSEMTNGHFLPCSVITIVFNDGQTYLTDGRHRLRAVVKSGTAQWFWVLTLFGVEPKDVYTVQDAGSARTMRDVVRALGVMDDIDIPVVGNDSIVTAARQLSQPYILSNSIPKSNAQDLAAMLLEWAPYMQMYGEALLGGGPTARMMRSSPFIVAGAVTFRYRPREAQQFWSGIAQDDGLSRYDARKRIVGFLLDSESILRVNFGGNAIKHYRVLAYYWNKFLKGEEVKRVPNPYPSDFIFDGTGWGSPAGMNKESE